MNKPLRVLYFGSYSYANPRNAVLIKGLEKNGVTILECNDRSRSFVVKYIKLFFKYLKFIGKFDVMLVGFSGQEMMPLARILTRKPIVFDVFTSHYMGYILDRKYFSPQSLRAKYYGFIDRMSCRLADIVLLDTQAHINYFVKEFDVPLRKFRKIWLGADSDVYYPIEQAPRADGDFSRIVFWGNFIPLQGVETIIKAAKILENKNVTFYMIGKGQTLPACEQLSNTLGLKNVQFLGWVGHDDLRDYISSADICLGAFSGSIKADITIQNKIFESLAMHKALITAETTANQELLTDGENCL
ncbi:MAG: glycosyltransferase, partial [Patescibacteria group bacterium]